MARDKDACNERVTMIPIEAGNAHWKHHETRMRLRDKGQSKLWLKRAQGVSVVGFVG